MTMNYTPFISVIIPTYHDWDRLKLCLEALKIQTYSLECFEVLVVNNDPDDLPPYKINSGNVRLLKESKKGSYAARNAGIMQAKSEILAFIDSDCIPKPNWLRNGIVSITDDSENSIVAGHVNVFPKLLNKPNIVELFSMNFELNQEKYVKIKRFATANVFIKKNVFKSIGNFNHSLKSNGDFELATRAVNNFFSIKYCKNCVVDHPARSSFNQISIKAKRKAGGAYDSLSILKISVIRLVLSIFKLFMTDSLKVLISKNSVKNKLKLIFVIIFYQTIKILELMNLIFRKKNSERR